MSETTSPDSSSAADRRVLRETLERLASGWRAQVVEGDDWVAGQPMKLSSDELGMLSQCTDELEALLASLVVPQAHETEEGDQARVDRQPALDVTLPQGTHEATSPECNCDIDTRCALHGARGNKQKEIDAAWFQIEHGWDIEPRDYFEREAPKNGFTYPLAQAVHHIWKRQLKEDAALALPRGAPETELGWQPIATAPKDGTPFRVFAPSLVDLDFNPGGSAEAVYDPERIIAAKWDGQHDVWVTVFVDDATHWMPLPASPLPVGEGRAQETKD